MCSKIAKRIDRARRIMVVGIDFAPSLSNLLARGLVSIGYDAEAPAGFAGNLNQEIFCWVRRICSLQFSFGRCLAPTLQVYGKIARRPCKIGPPLQTGYLAHGSHAESSPIRKQGLPRCPAAVIDRRIVRLRTRLPLLWAYAHLEWDVDLTHRLVDPAWLRGGFEAVCEQVRPQRKCARG